MKAIVLASQAGISAVLLHDGSIRNLPREYAVGQEIHVSSRQGNAIRFAVIVAAVMILFGILGWNYRK